MSLERKKRKPRKFKTMLSVPQFSQKKEVLLPKSYLGLLFLLISLFSLLMILFLRKTPLSQLFGVFSIILVINFVYGIYLVSFHRKILVQKLSVLKFLLFLMIPLLYIKVALAFELPLEAFSGEKLFPFGLFAVILSLGYSSSLGMVTTLWISIFLSLILNSTSILTPSLFFPVIAGGMFAIYTFDKIKTAVGLQRLGLGIGIVQSLAFSAVLLFQTPDFWQQSSEFQKINLYYPASWWLLNGIVSGWILSESLPFVEKIFQIVTNISLQKLAEQNHSLLKKLNMVAPGTYHHSIMVATLAEAASETIGVNALLTRVGAYFHDIGKMVKPDYYIENISPRQANKHDSLSPAMSTLIIQAHPRDGAEMGREYGLPKRVIDFMLEHHGTTLVKFFYQKACILAKENGDEVDQASFRYPGPKPQTKESAIVALADPVEAASRTLIDPTPTSIQKLVEALVDDRIRDGQLDECDLTMQEIYTIKKVFVRMLLSIFHGRISYDQSKKSTDKREDEEKKKKNKITSEQTAS